MRKIINILFVLCLVALPIIVSAYTLLQPLPGLTEEKVSGEGAFTNYLTWLFKFMLVVAGFAAVIQIAIGGVQMIIGGANENQITNAKSRIWDAIWGLLLALGAWLILFTINPDLAKMKLVIPEIKIKVEAPLPPLIDRSLRCQDCKSLSDIRASNEVLYLTLNSIIKGPSTCKGECQFSDKMANKLKNLAGNASVGAMWKVTEGYPPFVEHNDPCHYTGRCVDIALNQYPSSQTEVDKLIQAAQKSGFQVINEYSAFGGKKYDTTTGGCLHIKF